MNAVRFVPFVLLLLVVLTMVACGGNSPPDAEVTILNPSAVPENLRPAIPVAQRFGIGDDGYREDALHAASDAEIQELRQTVVRHGAEIDRWLNSLDPDQEMSDEAAAFMYMLVAHEEIGL